jgi:hypothetical protein
VKNRTGPALSFCVVLILAAGSALPQAKVTSPKEQLGFNIGDDYQLANYTQLLEYWKKLDAESDRLSVVDIGQTAEGRPMRMAIVTSPENHKKLARYKETGRRLALAEGLSSDEARRLAAEGKSVVWIDGGLHATEVLGAQQLIETVYQLVSGSDRETLRILDDVIVLATLVNPDGMELVSNWYMRNPEPARRSTSGLPRLYQKYIGHDNNRDFYMSNQPETEAINRVFYLEWFPQIVYNHHQTGPAGTVLFAPPFRDPFNYYCDPLVPMGIDLVGAAMHNRFVAENKPGATMRSGSNYSTWWNGGLRTTVYFHNMIGLLTETIGNPTPMQIPFVPANQLPRGDLPFPVPPQTWHFRQSIEYSLTANRAVLDLASRYREQLLFNIYRMGMNSIERGSRDNWTVRPKQIAALETALRRDRAQGDNEPEGGRGGRGGFRPSGAPAKYYEMLRARELRDPRGYILPSDQPDFLTATKFVNALLRNGVAVQRATAAFDVAGKRYPAGSYVVKSAQAFRPHVLDMFEPQDHPDDIAYPGGPPRPPYDVTGWTLALQMGVKFDRILDGFDGPFEKISGLVRPAPGKVSGATGAAGYLSSHQPNDAFVAINRLLAGGESVYWLKAPLATNAKSYPAGTLYIPAKPTTRARLEKLAAEVGLDFDAVAAKPAGEALELRKVRIGLWDRYGGSMPSGWTRWLLEKFEFPFEVVYAPALDRGDLETKFDALVFVTGGIPGREGGRGAGGGDAAPAGDVGERFGAMPDAASVPQEYRDRLGAVSLARTVPHLKRFLEGGGTILTIGTSTSLAQHLGLPIASALTEKLPNGTERPLPREKFYVPGSILRAQVDARSPLSYGMPEQVSLVFDNSPVFRLLPEAVGVGLRPVAWYAGDQPLESGWALGQGYLKDGIAAAEAAVGKGKLFLFGPEILFRGQPHGSFKFLFNGIYYGRAASVTLP